MNLKIPSAIFLLIPFSNIKKSILTNLKIPGAIFLSIPFSNIKKIILTNLKTPLSTLIIIVLKETIYIKTIIQTDKHKAKIYNYCMYTQIIFKNFLLFFFTVFKNEQKEHKF